VHSLHSRQGAHRSIVCERIRQSDDSSLTDSIRPKAVHNKLSEIRMVIAARNAYFNETIVELRVSISAIAIAPSSPIRLSSRLYTTRELLSLLQVRKQHSHNCVYARVVHKGRGKCHRSSSVDRIAKEADKSQQISRARYLSSVFNNSAPLTSACGRLCLGRAPLR
jgi:hypothetical protein